MADPAIVSLSYGAWLRWLRDDAAGARAMSDDAIARAARLGHPFTISLATCFDLWLRQFDGEAADVVARAEAATAYATEQGFDFWLGWAALLQGWAVARLGDAEDGIAIMRKGLVDWQATGSRLGTSYFLTLLAEGQALAGHAEQAIETLEASETFALEFGEHFWLPETYRQRAAMVAATDPDHAKELPRSRGGAGRPAGLGRARPPGRPGAQVASGSGHSKLGPAVRPSEPHGMRMRATACQRRSYISGTAATSSSGSPLNARWRTPSSAPYVRLNPSLSRRTSLPGRSSPTAGSSRIGSTAAQSTASRGPVGGALATSLAR